jgi:CLIP-associating protein 1/2
VRTTRADQSISHYLQSSDSSPGKERGQRQPKPRRGGFGDAGTMGSNGELPVAPIVEISSERQLSDEFQSIIDGLEPNLPWDQRVTAMLRLEGLVKGGAAELPAFIDLLPSTQACIAAQLQDRRSAISRQACHLISTLVQACGSQAEPLAAALFPVVFKAQGMSIQIVTEASDACLRTIIQHCPSSRLLPTLCSTVKTSKNVKLRLSAAEHLLLAVREWDAALLDRQAEAVETSIMSASADPTGETREAGRNAFVVYYAKRPAQAQVMLKKIPDTERSLKEKLQTAVKKALGSSGK